MEHSYALHRKIENWRAIQATYTPAVPILLARAANEAPHGSAAILPHDSILLLPSDLVNRTPCDSKLMEYEWRLRTAQAQDALNELRDGLRIRSHQWKIKRRDVHGVAANTRAQANICRQQEKIDSSALKYRVTRKALVQLAPALGKQGWEAVLPVLKPEDVRGMRDDEPVLHVRSKAHSKRKAPGTSEGKRKISWIWTDHTAVAQAGVDPGLNDGKTPAVQNTFD